MARTAKTNHVMSLVGEKRKVNAPKQEVQKPKKEEKAPTRVFNPALMPVERDEPIEKTESIEEELHPEKKDIFDSAAAADQAELTQQANQAEQPNQAEQEKTESVNKEEDAEKGKELITAVVPDLINQELEAIVDRFKIEPTDSNLWQLTKAALEAVRPEFSLNAREYREKCERLRQKVILEMTKAAIRLSKANRKR